MTTSIDVINLALFDIGKKSIVSVDDGGVAADTAPRGRLSIGSEKSYFMSVKQTNLKGLS